MNLIRRLAFPFYIVSVFVEKGVYPLPDDIHSALFLFQMRFPELCDYPFVISSPSNRVRSLALSADLASHIRAGHLETTTDDDGQLRITLGRCSAAMFLLYGKKTEGYLEKVRKILAACSYQTGESLHQLALCVYKKISSPPIVSYREIPECEGVEQNRIVFFAGSELEETGVANET